MANESQARRGAADMLRLTLRTDDPPAETGYILVYSRLVDGIVRTLARFPPPDGKIVIIL